jgi:hypothetical protein
VTHPSASWSTKSLSLSASGGNASWCPSSTTLNEGKSHRPFAACRRSLGFGLGAVDLDLGRLSCGSQVHTDHNAPAKERLLSVLYSLHQRRKRPLWLRQPQPRLRSVRIRRHPRKMRSRPPGSKRPQIPATRFDSFESLESLGRSDCLLIRGLCSICRRGKATFS